MGYKENEPDVEKALIKWKVQVARRAGINQPEKHPRRSALLGALAALVILAIVTVIAITVYESNKSIATTEEMNNCGPFSYPDVNISELSPRIISQQQTCVSDINGSCWMGERCYDCFKLDNWTVGNIDGVPVCCPGCELFGMILSSNSCDCRNSTQ